MGQLKKQDNPIQIRNELMRPTQDSFLGLSIFDPSKISISHSVSMSYLSMGGQGLAQNLYLNTLRYQIASPLALTVQWGVQNFPHNSIAKDHPAFQNGFFLSGAELRYQPSKNFELLFQYNAGPGLYNRQYYNRPYGFPRQSSLWDEE